MRRPFILLELFLALALISLCLIPIASHPFKIYKKEINLLIQMELEKKAEIAFRDLLLELPHQNDLQIFEKTYTIQLDKNHSWDYVAHWELNYKIPGKKSSSKMLLKATLTLKAEDSKLPFLENRVYKYFIAKNESPSQREDHGTT